MRICADFVSPDFESLRLKARDFLPFPERGINLLASALFHFHNVIFVNFWPLQPDMLTKKSVIDFTKIAWVDFSTENMYVVIFPMFAVNIWLSEFNN